MELGKAPKTRIDLPVIVVKLEHLSAEAITLYIAEYRRVIVILKGRTRDKRLTRAARVHSRNKTKRAKRTLSRLERELASRPPEPSRVVVSGEWPEKPE
jgi:hypothetical protein